MNRTAAVLALLAVSSFSAGCHHAAARRPPAAATASVLAAGALLPSPRLHVGRIIAVDAAQGFAFVELAPDAPGGAQFDGTELLARTPDLRPTARLAASRYLRGRTLGTRILAGQPSPGDEVVWLAP